MRILHRISEFNKSKTKSTAESNVSQPLEQIGLRCKLHYATLPNAPAAPHAHVGMDSQKDRIDGTLWSRIGKMTSRCFSTPEVCVLRRKNVTV